MGDVKVWREGAAGEPKFPDNFEVAKKAVLQVTDIKTNRNKYYAVELHSSKSKFRVYTHYGRTDDLDTNPAAGARESRYFDSLPEAQGMYDKIYKEKTSAAKGYKELALASSKIGSKKTMGQSSGVIDDKTLKKIADQEAKDTTTPQAPRVTLHKDIQEIVSYLYSEATNALISTVNATITANGIETPLGVLTLGQIDKGQAVLEELAASLAKKKKDNDKLLELSGDFYTVIPHRFGRSKEQALLAVIDTADKVNDKQDTLQLMRDMLNVNGKTNVLVNPEIEQKYKALGCEIELVDSTPLKEMKDYFEKSVIRGSKVKVKNLWKIKRPDEHEHFAKDIDNQRLLFHGSASKNWVGILSRGLLLPKIVVTLGVHRTDAGWLGSGIYFGDAACTAAGYAHPGKKNTRFIAIANVALGKMKDYRKITYGLSEPPAGYDSTHGVRGSEFADNEYVIYKHNQQRLEYLVECTYGY
jgi:poly [ADP-ribose] polymerase 2/3/4